MTRNKNEIRRTEDLPNWFKIDHYKKAEKLDYHGWYDQLIVRSYLLDAIRLLKLSPIDSHEDTKQCLLRATNEILKVIQSHGVLNVNDPSFITASTDFCLFYGLIKRQFPIAYTLPDNDSILEERGKSLGIHAFRTTDLAILFSRVGSSRQKELASYLGSVADYFCDPSNKKFIAHHVRHWKWFDAPIHEPRKNNSSQHLDLNFACMVDFTLPDHTLKILFEQWLKEMRHQTNVKSVVPQYTENDLKKWCDQGILPYLDLTIWARENNVQITAPTFIDAIYPKNKPITSNDMSRTNAKNALALVNRTTSRSPLNILRAQALLEHALKRARLKKRSLAKGNQSKAT